MYYIVSKIYIGGRFVEDSLYSDSQQILSVVAKASMIPITLYKEHQRRKPFNKVTLNATPKQIKQI